MTTDWKKTSDEAICQMIKDGNHEGMDYLLNKYKEMVRKKARSFYLIGGEKDDLIQEGMIGLMKAVRSFNADMDNSFYAFADLCIDRQIYSAVKASQRSKHMPLNSYISIYQPAQEEENAPVLIDVLPQSTQSPEDVLINREYHDQLWEKLINVLSPMEKKVLDLFMEGLGYSSIAQCLGKDEKSVDNALQRIRNKASKLQQDTN